MKENTNTNAYENAKRTFENEYRNNPNSAATESALITLASATVHAVLKKVIDPQRSGENANTKGSPDNSGQNPALVALKREAFADVNLLDATRRNANAATSHALNADGDNVKVVTDKTALDALNSLIAERLGDGMDLVQEVALTIWEQAQKHATNGEWLDEKHLESKISRRVYADLDTPPEWKEVEIAPAQEAFRAARRCIENSRSVKPTGGQCAYIEDFATAENGGLETIYRRLGKYADLGGYAVDGYTRRESNLYTVDETAARNTVATVEKLALTDRQAAALKMRMQGMSCFEIGKRLGVTETAIERTFAKMRLKAAAIGIAPKGWTPNEVCEAKPVAQYSSGKFVQVFVSPKKAAEITGVNAGNIRQCASGKRKSAGGFVWKYI